MNDHHDDATDRPARTLKLSVETEPAAGAEEDAGATGAAGAGAAVPPAADGDDLRDAVGFVKGLGATAWRYADLHPYTVFYGFAGLVLAVLILLIGLWDTIVIAVFVMVGAMIGQIRDGDNGIVNFFSRLFGGGR